MDWAFLLIAGLLEVGFTTSLKLSQGFTRVWPTCFFLIFSCLSFFYLNKALSSIPLGVAYTVWTGIGAAGTLIVSIYYFGEVFSTIRLVFLFLLIISIAGIKLFP